MTRYTIPSKEEVLDPAVNEKKEKRKKLLVAIRKKRAKVLSNLYKR